MDTNDLASSLETIITGLENAVAIGDLGAISNLVAELRRLCVDLEADAQRTKKAFLEELMKLKSAGPLEVRVDQEIDAGDDHGRSTIFRRRECYRECWWFPEVVLAADAAEAKEQDFAFQGEGYCDYGEFQCADEVKEVSANDLDDAEAKAVAKHVADEAECEQMKQMPPEQLRNWLSRKFSGDQQTS